MSDDMLIAVFAVIGLIMAYICVKNAKQLITEKEDEMNEQNI